MKDMIKDTPENKELFRTELFTPALLPTLSKCMRRALEANGVLELSDNFLSPEDTEQLFESMFHIFCDNIEQKDMVSTLEYIAKASELGLLDSMFEESMMKGITESILKANNKTEDSKVV